ncbi:MAG: IclR family transcriptional regulator [Solirubrobacteraceae bacterium]
MTPGSADPRIAPAAGSTRTVDRAFELLGAVTERGHGGGSLSELARAAGLSPATASRLLATLVKRGLVHRDEQGSYRPGLGLMQMAAVVLRGEPLYELAGGHLVALARETGETANLGVAVDHDRALYLRQVAGDQRVQTTAWSGRTIPRIGTSMGAALAGMVSADGYAVSRGSLEPDITSVAVPVRDYQQEIVAVLSILAPSYRTADGDIERYGALLVQHATALSSALGA